MKQKVFGIVFLFLSIGIIVLAAQGHSVEDRDATPVLFIGPLGLYLLCTKEDCMHNADRA